MQHNDLIPLNGWFSDVKSWAASKVSTAKEVAVSNAPAAVVANVITFPAAFEAAYKVVKKHEGGYANIAGDKGGETYMGIARNISPNEKWSGWKIIDAYKKKYGALKNNQFIPNDNLTALVKQYYYSNWWLPNALDKVVDADVAVIIFDWCVNSGSNGDRGVQKVLRDQFSKAIQVDGAIGAKTVAAINSIDPETLYQAIKDARIAYYKSIATGNNAQFLKGWLKRINSFWYKGIVKDKTSAVLQKIGLSEESADKLSIPVLVGSVGLFAGLTVLTYKLIQRAKNH